MFFLQRLDLLTEAIRPFNVVTVPFPVKEVNRLWDGFFIMPYTAKPNDLHGRPIVNTASGATFFIHDKHSSTLSKSPGWVSLKTMEQEISQSRKQVSHSERREVH